MRVCEGILRNRINKGDILIGGGVFDSRSPAVMEIYQEAGFDFAYIDREHTALSDETIADHIRIARCLGFPSMVRVAEDCYHELNRTLDQAPDCIFIPRIRNREQVENIIQTVKYKPEGNRGLASASCPVGKYTGWNSITEQTETVNLNTVVGIQIETADALADLDGILSVKGVDIALVGNDDLSLSMGIPGQTGSQEYIQAVNSVIAACHRHGVAPGIAAGSPDAAVYWITRGMQVVWYSCDICILLAACTSQLGEIRKSIVLSGSEICDAV